MEHGIITTVNYKEGVVTCNVQAIRVNTEYRKVPVMKPYSGSIRMPKPGQKAVMDVLDDGTRFIVGYIAREESFPDSMANGEMTIQVDDQTVIALKQNGSDWDLNLSASGNVTVDAPNGDVTINAPAGAVDVDGDTVSIDASSNVTIDGIDFDQHTHDYGDTTISDTGDGSGSSSTSTETTSPPS